MSASEQTVSDVKLLDKLAEVVYEDPPIIGETRFEDPVSVTGNSVEEPVVVQPLPASFFIPAPIKKAKKVGRNDMCPCGSGKKLKRCCIDTYRE